jgi:hypothetical protein
MTDVYSVVDALATANKALDAVADRLKSDSRVVGAESGLWFFRFVPGPHVAGYAEATLETGEVYVWGFSIWLDPGDHSWSITSSVDYLKVAGADPDLLIKLPELGGTEDEAFVGALREATAALAKIELDEAIASQAKASISEA